MTEIQIQAEGIAIVYFCRECQKVVQGKSMGRRKKYTFKCPVCENVCAYGTSRGIVNFFRVRENDENWVQIHGNKTELLSSL